VASPDGTPSVMENPASVYPVSSNEIDSRYEIHTAHYLKLAVGFFSLMLTLTSILDILFLGSASLPFIASRIAVAILVPLIWYKTRNSETLRFHCIHAALLLSLVHTLWITGSLSHGTGLFYLHLMAAVYLLTPVFVLWGTGHMLFQWSVAAVFILIFSLLIPHSVEVYLQGGLVLLFTTAAGVLIPRIARPFRREVALTRILLEKGVIKPEKVSHGGMDEAAESNAENRNDKPLSARSDPQGRPRFITFEEAYSRRVKTDTADLERVDLSELVSQVLKDVRQKSISNDVRIKLIRPGNGLMVRVHPENTQKALLNLCDELISKAAGRSIQVMTEANEYLVLIHVVVSDTGIAADDFAALSAALDELAPGLEPYTELKPIGVLEAVAHLHQMRATLLHTRSDEGVYYVRFAFPFVIPAKSAKV